MEDSYFHCFELHVEIETQCSACQKKGVYGSTVFAEKKQKNEAIFRSHSVFLTNIYQEMVRWRL